MSFQPTATGSSSTCSSIQHLPAEILKNIAQCVSRKTLLTLVCVCRSWNGTLIPQLYHSIPDLPEKRFGSFIQTLERTATTKQLGHFVRRFTLPNHLEENDLSLLPRLCPYVVEVPGGVKDGVNLLPYLLEWTHINKLSVYIDDGPLPLILPMDFLRGRLTQLSITIQDYEESVDIITGLPLIETLSLECPMYFLTDFDGKFSFSSLEKIHNALQFLRSLRVSPINIIGEMPEKIRPCSTLRELTLRPRGSHLWGKYFAQKYTHLESLTIDSNEIRIDDELKTGALPLAKSCKKLQTLTLTNERVYSWFMDIFQSIGAPMTRFGCCLWNQDWVSKMIHSFCRTLTWISIDIDTPISTKKLMELLQPCRYLVHLHVGCWRCDFALDGFLDGLKGLQHLSISANRISVHKMESSLRHKLCSLAMRGKSDIDNEVYLYLAKSCPCLSSLDCLYSAIFPRSPIVYCPQPNLRTLRVFDHSNFLFKLTFLGDQEDSQENTKGSDKSAKEGYTRWYYSEGFSFQNHYHGNNRQLTSREVKEMLGNDTPNKSSHIYKLRPRKMAGKQGEKHTNDKPSKFISIQCHYVDVIEMNTVQVCN
ncbi:hypothetical protein EC973_004863 [Apophysomyces ossiformis]|uniref:F-box domain-containing protein n=1 Tax=Apophysomyces ossiformis TaxID=679940 RepID=A0A8H7BHT8_9FUNG|nr:hypothetical protein EC973_004863 [Apophysomyces ossiformis]